MIARINQAETRPAIIARDVDQTANMRAKKTALIHINNEEQKISNCDAVTERVDP